MALNDGRLIPTFIQQAIAGEPLTVYGDGSQTRSFCYVSDMVDALLRFMARDGAVKAPVMNLGNPDKRTVLSVAEKILQASTSEVYGDPEIHPQVESYRGSVNPIGPRACYDEGKRAAETLFVDYHRMNKVNVRIVRIFNTYGPRMHPNDGRVVSNFIVQALKGEPITLYGDGSQTRSFCYVDDLIEGFLRLMASPDDVTGPINIGNPGEFTIRELAEKVIALTGSASELVHRPLPENDPTQRQPDIARAKAMLGWEPTIALEQGLGKTIAYFDALLSGRLETVA
jgi:UDP-glucuronate decarboxylase